MKKQQYIIFIPSFDVLNKRKVSSIYKGLAEVKDEAFVGHSLWMLGDRLTYEMSDSFPLQNEQVRIDNMRNLLKEPEIFHTEKGIKDGAQYREENYPNFETRYLLLRADPRKLVKNVANILFHQGLQYGIVDAFSEDKKDFIAWQKRRERKKGEGDAEEK